MTEIKIEDGRRPDLYIALVAAAGTDLGVIKTQIRAQLAAFRYKCEEVKASELIGNLFGVNQTGLPEHQRIRQLMDAGDELRQKLDSGDAVMSLVISKLISLRKKLGADETGLVGSTAFIIDSLKNPFEIEVLDKLYGRNFYTISVFDTETNRLARLANKIAKSKKVPTKDEHRESAAELISIDQKRDSSKLTQNVRNTFPLADFFVDYTAKIESQLARFFGLVFGEPFITPTFDEYAMFTAKAVSLRSCDLSRQVGAAIFDDQKSLISSGFNDVPYPGGGTWVEGDEGADNRDHTIQFDPNSSEISKLLGEIMLIMNEAKFLSPENEALSADELVSKLSSGAHGVKLGESRVRNLIEFGRVVHAEMHAICEAARLGRPVKGARLYCTTYPCHICARHIIAAGISEVVFIEPYPKSLTEELYGKETTLGRNRGALDGAVQFRTFHGVAPLLYRRVFSYRKRKDESGRVVTLDPQRAIPVGATFGINSARTEANLVARLDEFFGDSTVKKIQPEDDHDTGGNARSS
jgi:cytidine deaminase